MNISSFGVLASGLVFMISACSSSSDGGSGGSGGAAGATGGTSASAAGSGGKASTGGSSGSTSTSGGSGGASTGGTGGAATGTSGAGGGSSASAFSCARTADGTCASYSSVPPNSASTYCSDGTVVTTCPTADLQASCTFTSAGVDEVFYYYTSGGHSNAAIKTVCDSESGVLKTF